MTAASISDVASGTTATSFAVSVVIPTYRRDDLLRRCLEALAGQTLERVEIIVVDDACSDTTPGVIAGALADHPDLSITLLPGRRLGPATARNIGWRAASSEVIAFMDDDAFPASADWLARGVEHFSDPAVNAVSGSVRVPVDEPPTDFQRNVKGLEKGEFLTCNVFYRRDALAAVGGFDEQFRAPFREDSDLQFRVEGLGGVMRRDEGLVVVHPAPRGRFGLSLRLQRNSMYNALVQKKHPGRYKSLSAPVPLHYYATCAGAGLGLMGLLRGNAVATKLGSLAWFALTTRFLMRRARGVDHSPAHLADLVLTSVLIPPLSIYWRLRGAIKFRVWFF